MRVGIVGAGQLARMLALAGIPMGIEFNFLLKKQDDNRCVEGFGTCYRLDNDTDTETLKQFAANSDVITIESEQVNIEYLEKLQQFCNIYPPVNAVRELQNRVREKQVLQDLKINTAPHFVFHSHAELLEKHSLLEFPFVIKSASDGYDGKNQYRVKDKNQLLALADKLPEGHAFIAEAFIKFTREISFIAVRSRGGEIRFYTPIENVHCDGILHSSLAPAPNTSDVITKTGQEFFSKLLNHLDYVGVAAMECFEVHDDQGETLLVNEIAPRVHNSGHWTDAGCNISQFENHLRAVLDLALGSTEHHGFTYMINILGKGYEQLPPLTSDTALHWYNKTTRPGRKMGHINIYGQNTSELKRQKDELYNSL